MAAIYLRRRTAFHAMIDEELDLARERKDPGLEALLEHRYWITVIMGITPAIVRIPVLSFLLNSSAKAYSDPDTFAKIHFNIPLLLHYWISLQVNIPGQKKGGVLEEMLDNGTIEDHLEKLGEEGSCQGIAYVREGATYSFPPTSRVERNLAELEEKRRIYATSIFQNYHQLRKIVMSTEGRTLKKRCTKRYAVHMCLPKLF